MNHITLRPARIDSLEALRAIERAAFETLREAGAVSGAPTVASLETYQRLLLQGVLLVAVTGDDLPVGFAGGWRRDGWLHIAEVDVHPAWQRQGIGRMLMTALLAEGRACGLRGASLTTDRYAPFNAPFYASMGFSALDDSATSPRLKQTLAAEIHAGMDPERRVAMALLF